MLANIDQTWNIGAPALVLASCSHPIFAVIIFLGIYTSAVTLLWTGIRTNSEDGTICYKIGIIVGGEGECV